jgi:hypothetical protein
MTSILTRRRTVIGLAVLSALLAGGAWWRAAWIVNQLLGSWAEATVAEKSSTGSMSAAYGSISRSGASPSIPSW